MTPFASWQDVVAAALFGDRLWYKAPLDRVARCGRVLRVYRNVKIKIGAWSSDMDPFTADAGHLERFGKKS